MIAITRTEKLALGILALNYYNQRRCMTEREYGIFSNALHQEYNYADCLFNAQAQEELASYFDEIKLDKQLVYRIRPDIEIKDLKKYVAYFPVKFIQAVNKAILSLNDLTKEEEDNLEEFKRIDEQYQLKTILEICNLEKKKREAEKRLEFINSNSNGLVDACKVEDILEHNDNLNEEALITKYYR